MEQDSLTLCRALHRTWHLKCSLKSHTKGTTQIFSHLAWSCLRCTVDIRLLDWPHLQIPTTAWSIRTEPKSSGPSMGGSMQTAFTPRASLTWLRCSCSLNHAKDPWLPISCGIRGFKDARLRHLNKLKLKWWEDTRWDWPRLNSLIILVKSNKITLVLMRASLRSLLKRIWIKSYKESSRLKFESLAKVQPPKVQPPQITILLSALVIKKLRPPVNLNRRLQCSK